PPARPALAGGDPGADRPHPRGLVRARGVPAASARLAGPALAAAAPQAPRAARAARRRGVTFYYKKLREVPGGPDGRRRGPVRRRRGAGRPGTGKGRRGGIGEEVKPRYAAQRTRAARVIRNGARTASGCPRPARGPGTGPRRGRAGPRS